VPDLRVSPVRLARPAMLDCSTLLFAHMMGLTNPCLVEGGAHFSRRRHTQNASTTAARGIDLASIGGGGRSPRGPSDKPAVG